MPNPRVSMLMTLYNAEAFVVETMESVLAQTFDDFEFVIVDDGSTDRSLAIVRRFQKQDPRVRILSRPNTGIVGALNDGLQACVGEYVARIDADDLCESERLSLQVARLDKAPDLVALGCCAIAVDPKGRELGAFDVPLSHEDIERNHLQGVSSIHHPAVMMRREAVNRAGGYREGFCPAEDYDLWLRLGEIGRLENLPQRLIRKRLTLSGIVASTLDRQRDVVKRALADAYERRGLADAPEPSLGEVRRTRDILQQWGWMALQTGRVGAARLYAVKSLVCSPWNLSSWRLAYCAMRGR